MTLNALRRILTVSLVMFLLLLTAAVAQAQGEQKSSFQLPTADSDSDHVKERAEWFSRGRVVPGKSAAELRHRAYQAKMRARAASGARTRETRLALPATVSSGWTPLGPVPLSSDASGGFQDYHQVSGRATAVAIDPADSTGNTLFIGGAQGGVWKSTNAANSTANNVTWTAVTDDQATLSTGAIVVQPGNSNPASSVVLVGTGEADNSGDSYFGLGILRSADGGNSWTLASTANSTNGTISFSGLGATRMAFSTAGGQTNTVVAAMAATSEGIVENSLSANTYRGLYTSTDAGQTWTFDNLFGAASESTSATSVVYNAAAGLFFAAERYHGIYWSPDGLSWTRLANQPGAPGLLSATNCPNPYSTSCPIYRAEITVVPGRKEMYVWFVSAGLTDEGIWQSKDSGNTWTQISEGGITNCGDSTGCGVQQGSYNLELLAVPNGLTATDLYAGAINLYKCSINTSNPTCSNSPFLNLTHVYGCDPIGALAHVHPDQHALASAILASGADLMYFANDGGIYRSLDGFSDLNTGSCSGTNLFDDLNQNLGSMTQFVSFSQHPTDPNTLLGGTQDNGSPASATATTSLSWLNVLGGDGGYNAIDPANANDWFASEPDIPPSGLNIQECSSGVSCNNNGFRSAINSGSLGGDDGSFYFPFILDPQSTTALLVGTCRIWRGPRLGGSFTELSLNFDTLGVGTCSGAEVNTVRTLAAGGPADANGSRVVYAGTNGSGPNGALTPVGGDVWVTTNASAVNGVSSTFVNVTLNAPGGSSINPNQFPVAAVAIDDSDLTGSTAYAGIMGFTGGPGHIWQTTNAGASWIDFTANLPDSPVNAIVVDAASHTVYVGTDVGVFQSSTSVPAWTEVGPTSGQPGFLPNVAVTALAIFNSGSQKLLRASTYGRGIWQFNLIVTPDFQISIPTPALTVFSGNTPIFNGTVTAVNGYASAVTLSCTSGTTVPPTPCIPKPATFTPASTGTAFSITTGGVIGDFSFNIQGADSNNLVHSLPVTLSVVNLGLSSASPTLVIEPRGATSPPVNFQLTAQGSFNQSVSLTCGISPGIVGAVCAFIPGSTVDPTSADPVNGTVTVTAPAGTAVGNYTVTIQAATAGSTPLTTTFTLAVTLNPTFVFSEPAAFPTIKAGSTGTTGPITISSQDGFAGTVALSCANTFGSGSCSVNPTSVSAFPSTANLVINGTSFSSGQYQLAFVGTSGAITNFYEVPFNVSDYSITGPATLSASPGNAVSASLALTSTLYVGQINATCDATALPAAQCTLTPASPISVASGATVAITASINVPTSALPGVYNINIDTEDVGGSPSHNLTMALTVNPDFSLSLLTPSTQTITVGGSASYNFSVLPVGTSFNNAVNLSCSGAPAISLCSFSPNPVTPGTSSAAAVMTISTTASSSRSLPLPRPIAYLPYALGFSLPAIVLGGKKFVRRKRRIFFALLGLFTLSILLASCGGGGSNGTATGGQQQGTMPGTYTITVTATSGTAGTADYITHSASPVTLIVSQ